MGEFGRKRLSQSRRSPYLGGSGTQTRPSMDCNYPSMKAASTIIFDLGDMSPSPCRLLHGQVSCMDLGCVRLFAAQVQMQETCRAREVG